MLAVVDQQERLAVPDRSGDRLGEGLARLLAQPEHRGDGGIDEALVTKLREVDEPHRRCSTEHLSERDGKPRLTAPSGARDGDDPGFRQQVPNSAKLLVAVDEARQVQGKLAAREGSRRACWVGGAAIDSSCWRIVSSSVWSCGPGSTPRSSERRSCASR